MGDNLQLGRLSSRSHLACSVHTSHAKVSKASRDLRGPSDLLDMSNKVSSSHVART